MLRKLFAERKHCIPFAAAFLTQAQVLLELMLQVVRQLAILRENYVLLCTLTVHDAYSNQPLQRASYCPAADLLTIPARQRYFFDFDSLPSAHICQRTSTVSEHPRALPAACVSRGRVCS